MEKTTMQNNTLYCYSGLFIQKYFNTEEELITYNDNLDMSKYGEEGEYLKNLYTTFFKITYVGKFQDHEHCFRIISCKSPRQFQFPWSDLTPHYYSVKDSESYAIYNNQKRCWTYAYGSLKSLYEAFQERGLIIPNNPYTVDNSPTSKTNSKSKKLSPPSTKKHSN